MKPNELSDPGPQFRGLRMAVAAAVGWANAHVSHYSTALKTMLTEAAAALAEPVAAPTYAGDGLGISWVSGPAFTPSDNGTDYFSMDEEDQMAGFPGQIGTWTGSPTFSYQWYRFDGTTKTDIPGATAISYYPVAADVGFQIGVKITGTNAGGSLTVDYGRAGYQAEGDIVVFDADLLPNSIVSISATDGAATGDVDIVITPGEQIDGHPDTAYEIRFYDGSSASYHTITSATETISGIAPGTYDIYVRRVFNDAGAIIASAATVNDLVVT